MRENFRENIGRDVTSLEKGHAEIRGIGRRPPHALHEYWSAVLVAAANTFDASDGEEFVVETRVFVRHQSPGWVDGFSVKMTPGG
jgi:hypothetical protein